MCSTASNAGKRAQLQGVGALYAAEAQLLTPLAWTATPGSWSQPASHHVGGRAPVSSSLIIPNFEYRTANHGHFDDDFFFRFFPPTYNGYRVIIGTAVAQIIAQKPTITCDSISDSNWVSCINYVLLNLSGCIKHPDSDNMVWWGDWLTCRSLILHFFSLWKQRKESYKLQLEAPIFWSARPHQSWVKESRPTPPRHHPRATTDCNVFPFQFVKNVLAPSSQLPCGHHSLHQQLLPPNKTHVICS